jgi:hypothetical protein
MNTNYGCYVKKTKGSPRCKFCEKELKYGDAYARIYINRYANPYFHAYCLDKIAQKAQETKEKLKEFEVSETARVTVIRMRRELDKIEAKKITKKASFQKQIIRDALKTQNIMVSKVKIMGGGFNEEDIFRIRCDGGPFKIEHLSSIFNGDSVYIGLSKYWTRGTDVPPIGGNGCYLSQFCLADPNSLEKIGAEIVKFCPNLPRKPQKLKS